MMLSHFSRGDPAGRICTPIGPNHYNSQCNSIFEVSPFMTVDLKSSLVSTLEAAAAKAGLKLLSIDVGQDFHGQDTAIFRLGLDGADRSLRFELSSGFSFETPELLEALDSHLAAEAKRLRNPRPDCMMTLEGLPVLFTGFKWPCHQSVSGSDTWILHGEVHLEDGGTSGLHARISAAITQTFAEIVPSMEQPFAESSLYNAIRKTIDRGQLEFFKSGNRQAVPVTTRYYSRWQKKFLFTETNDAQRLEFLLGKVYWLSGVLGNSRPVWIADPRDTQYLNTTAQDLLRMANDEAAQGLLKIDGEFATATPQLMEKATEFRARMQAGLDFTRPRFNEEMRAGHANM